MSNAPSPSPPSGVPAAAMPGALPAPPPAPTPAPTQAPTIADVLRVQRMRIDGWTPVKVAAFISHLGTTGSVTQAAAYVQMTTASCYALRNRPGGEPFAEAWETAIAARHEMLCDIAQDRVLNGVERIRWYKGAKIGVDRIFSYQLLMHQLDATDPERRRARGRRDNGTEPETKDDIVPKSFDSAEPGEPAATLLVGPADSDLHAALAAELEPDLPPDVVAEMARTAECRRVARAEGAEVVAAIAAGIDAALGRPV